MTKSTLKACPFCNGDRGFWHDNVPYTIWRICRWCAGTGKAQRTLAEVGAE